MVALCRYRGWWGKRSISVTAFLLYVNRPEYMKSLTFSYSKECFNVPLITNGIITFRAVNAVVVHRYASRIKLRGDEDCVHNLR